MKSKECEFFGSKEKAFDVPSAELRDIKSFLFAGKLRRKYAVLILAESLLPRRIHFSKHVQKLVVEFGFVAVTPFQPELRVIGIALLFHYPHPPFPIFCAKTLEHGELYTRYKGMSTKERLRRGNREINSVQNFLTFGNVKI